MNIIALIPARSGSKGIKNKNIYPLGGIPLINYSINTALKSQNISRTIVTTDSEQIANIARKSGAEVPFLRPNDLSKDCSPDREYILHAINWLQTNENYNVDLVVILRPTTPFRQSSVIDQAITKIIKNDSATSLRSVHKLSEPPQKMLQIVDSWLTGFFPEDRRPEYFNLPRQVFPTAFCPNGYIDIVKTSYIQSNSSGIFGNKILGFDTPFSIEIDSVNDLEYAKYIISKKEECQTLN